MQHTQVAGAELCEERALIADGFALLVREVQRTNRGGRPSVIDEPLKARIATLMGAGLSMRQAAATLGINHATISRAVAADKALRHDIDCARTRSTLHPLACVLRESGRNWKAAVWLLEHLQQTARGEKSPLERADEAVERRVEWHLEQIRNQQAKAKARAILATQGGPSESATAHPRRSPRS